MKILFESSCIDFNEIFDFGGTRTILRSVVYNDAPLISSLTAAMPAAEKQIAEFADLWK